MRRGQAAFLDAVLNEYDWRECLKSATAAGAACMEGDAALSRIQDLGEFKQRIEDGWEKQDLEFNK